MALENVLTALNDEVGKINFEKQVAEQRVITLQEQLDTQVALYAQLDRQWQSVNQQLELLSTVKEENVTLKAEIEALKLQYENRIPLQPVLDLLKAVMVRVEERQNEALNKKWHWMLVAADPFLQQAIGGVKKDHEMVLKFVTEAKADGLVTDEELEAIGV